MGKIFLGFAFIYLVWVVCCVNTEYTYFSKGYLFTKAFKANTKFQCIFTYLHKDAHPVDRNKLTYIGYICSIISTVAMLTAASISLNSIITDGNGHELFIWTTSACVLLNISGILIKDIDGGLCWLIHKIKNKS